MSTDRVQACLEHLLTMHGGTPPAPERLVGLTHDERTEAELLFAATLDARRDLDDQVAHAYAALLNAEGDPDVSR